MNNYAPLNTISEVLRRKMRDCMYGCTCTELVMVLRAKIVAQSFTVDWLSNAPCVSISNTATLRKEEFINSGHAYAVYNEE